MTERESWFFRRTFRHISLVKRYASIIAPNYEFGVDLLRSVSSHDSSKFVREDIFVPYTWLTWRSFCKNSGLDFKSFNPPKDIDKKISIASSLHASIEDHHPEFWRNDGKINSPDLKIEGSVSCDMPEICLAEMCADWCAVSEEVGGSPLDWADENIGKRWVFEERQRRFIYECLDIAWN